MRKIIGFVVAILLLSQTIYSQIRISGPTCVRTGDIYTYRLAGAFRPVSHQWCVSNGTFMDITSSCVQGVGYLSVTVKWFTPGNGSLTVRGSDGSASIAPTITEVMQPGSVYTAAGLSVKTQNVLFTDIPGTIFCTAPSGGNCSADYGYQWQSAPDNINFANIPGATNENLSFSTPLSQTTRFRRVATGVSSGQSGFSDIAVVYVLLPLKGGSINNAGQAINYNTTPAAIDAVAASEGNCDGNYTYQWQSSTDNVSFFDITGANALNYAPGNLTGTTYYRRQVTCGTETNYTSNTAVVVVYPSMQAGSIEPLSQEIEYNASAKNLTVTGVSGGNGLYSYQWQTSNDGTNFNNINGATNSGYTPPALTSTTYYRSKVSSNGVEAYTAIATIVVNPISAGVITPGSLVIAPGTSPGELIANPASGGSCTYSYQWQHSTNGSNWIDISGATGQYYTPVALPYTHYFRRRVSCGTGLFYSNVCTITVGALTSCDLNFVRERIFTQPGILDKNTADAVAAPGSVIQTTQYLDGLGRPAQTVSKQASSDLKDIVTPFVYDEFGREAIKYLPYVAEAADGNYKCNPLPEQKGFNSIQFPNEKYYYKQISYEASPLNRTLRSYAPGDSWVGNNRAVVNKYFINTVDDDVRIWTVTDVANDFGVYSNLSGDGGRYPAGTLFKNVTINEHGKQVIEFKDREDNLILKKVQLTAAADNGDGSGYDGWLCTYYVYDDAGSLRCIIPPKGVEWLAGNNWDLNIMFGRIIDEQCFRYEYDGRDRVIRKKVPGAAEVLMVYDKRDRVVFTQDGNMRYNNSHQWLTTLYDRLNRPVATGLTTWTGTEDDLRQMADGSNGDYNLEGITISNYPVPAGAGFSLLTKTGYDNYDALPSSAWPLNRDIDNTYTGSNYLNTSYGSIPWPEPVTQSLQTLGLVTWTQTKILNGNDQYLYSVMIYDEKGRVVQVKSRNATNGTDVTTTQYTFSDQPLVVVKKQEKVGSGSPQTHIVVTKNNYNESGQLKSVTKKINSVFGFSNVAVNKPEVEILTNNYNVLGQLMEKSIGKKKDGNGNYTGAPLQTLRYDYNIRGWSLGINRNYLTQEGQTTDGTAFGFELGYDKTTNNTGENFGKGEYNGNITGMVWKSDGDDVRRKYDFTYDASGRLLQADFKQQNAADHLWNNSKVNFSARVGDGTLLSNGAPDPTKAYDANGNILQLQQWGVKTTGNTLIDDLVYSYYSGISNKVRTVTEQGGPVDHKLGDFTDGNTDDNDYGYDMNGNMIVDRNKGWRETIPGVPTGNMTAGGAVTYNHLNLPAGIVVKDNNGDEKGTINYVYDAAGNKLQKIVLEKNVSVTYNNQSYVSDITTTTTYIDDVVYESKSYAYPAPASLSYIDKLQFMPHEEGRVRYIEAAGDDPAHYEYDYFVKDHLGNVRMVLTEQSENHNYMATMERGDNNKVRGYENQLFSNLDASELATPDYYPRGTSVNDPNLYVAKVNGNDQKKGPAIVLKVMAGDVVSMAVQSFYKSGTTTGGTGNALNDILSSLAGGIVSASGVAKGTLNELSDPTSSPLLGALNAFRNEKNQNITDKPKAYLNWICLDEQFKYVGAYPQSNAVPVGGADKVNSLASPEITIAKNGYLYVYVSNETENWDVLFDDLSVNHHPGALLEETHYYPFGLTMAGISAKAIGKPENKHKFNKGSELENKEFSDGSGVEWYATDFRNYDPQIGRFHQQDPLADLYDNFSPYVYANNNPVLLNDPYGLAGDSVPLLPPVTVRPPKALPSQPSMPGGVQPTRAGVAPLFPLPTSPLQPVPPPGRVIPINPQPGPGPLLRYGGRALGTIGLLLYSNPAGRGSYRWPTPSTWSPWGGHGNDENNNNPHIVYRFIFTPSDTKTPVLKYGISDVYRNDLDRPEKQLPILRAAWGGSVKYEIMSRTVNRAVALYVERLYVTLHWNAWGEMPREQKRPLPF